MKQTKLEQPYYTWWDVGLYCAMCVPWQEGPVMWCMAREHGCVLSAVAHLKYLFVLCRQLHSLPSGGECML